MFGGNTAGGGLSFGGGSNSGSSGFNLNSNNTNNSNPANNNNLTSFGFGSGSTNNAANAKNSALGGFGFGNKTSTPAAPGFSFGAPSNNNSIPSNNASSGFTFGASNNTAGANNSSGGFSFGANKAANAGEAPSGTGFSLGSAANVAPSTGGGLFNNKPLGTGTGLAGASSGFNFGGSNTAAAKPGFNFGAGSTGTGLLGNNNSSSGNSGGLFGGNNSNNNNNNNNSAGTTGGLFGSKTAGASSLFGGNNASSGFSFGNKPALGSTSTSGGGLFGSNNNSNNNNPLGQNQQQMSQLTSMTRVSDLPDVIKNELQELDRYIQTQVSIAEYLQNQESAHKGLVESVPRDISFLEKKYISTNQTLNSDLNFVEGFKTKTLESFNNWVEKLIKVYFQLTNPMSNTSNDQSQIQSTSKVIIGVNGNRAEQQQQQQQKLQPVSDKASPINITEVLNSYYISKIEDFGENIEKYQLVLEEVENSVNDLDKSCNSSFPVDGNHGIEMIVTTLNEEFKLYVELTNEFAEIHHEVTRLIGGRDVF